MTPKQIALELYHSYTINGGNQHYEAINNAFKMLHVMAIINDMSYKQYYEISQEINKL